MAEILVYPYLSPRLVEVLAPDIQIDVQELVDLIRDWEDDDENVSMSFDSLISAAGKEDLGSSTAVGITATLNNTQVFFTPRSIPRDDGVGRTCDATDTNGRDLYVNDATFVTANVQRGDIIYNKTTGSSASILEVVDENNLKHLQLSGGTSTQWTNGDEYIVFEMIQCSIAGGNLVAVDDIGDTISPIFPSFGTHVVRTSSSSATLQSLRTIEHSVFNEGVTLDIGNVTTKALPGTDFPIGTLVNPSNNLVDADVIMIDNALNKIAKKGEER